MRPFHNIGHILGETLSFGFLVLALAFATILAGVPIWLATKILEATGSYFLFIVTAGLGYFLVLVSILSITNKRSRS